MDGVAISSYNILVKQISAKIKAYALILEGLVPSAPPTTEMLLIFTSDVNLPPQQQQKVRRQKEATTDHILVWKQEINYKWGFGTI